jgi:hypothetical protein
VGALPPDDNDLWKPRKGRGEDTLVPWGLTAEIRQGPPSNPAAGVTNLAGETEADMRDKYGMVFMSEPGTTDIATYTHGMIQAIYKAYALGPSCSPFEIAVGDLTKKMASCLPCTLFMCATGYPPTAIHLGSGESWAPLFAPITRTGRRNPTSLVSFATSTIVGTNDASPG